MKTFLIFLGLVAIVGLGFHDKQQTEDLGKERDQNAQLTQQLNDEMAANTNLQQQVRQLQAKIASMAQAPVNPLGNPPPLPQMNVHTSGQLERGSYGN